ncbi:helix-turn-helix domain-containing protein [Vreelandella jeotgali]|uniref:helix-turn-helix domain-containing protein n=1 Tax=Vreelandella jeotgali TaxID=553386 RepID=UPI00034BB4F1|nr:helix-turn-helix domain-containing protein [Halomonas jeotgali]
MAQNGRISQAIPLLSSPADHQSVIAPQQRGDMIAWCKGRKPEWPKIAASDAHKAAQDKLARWVDQPDIFITPNEFHGWRLIRLLSRINSLYVDIDMHNADGGVDMMKMAATAIDALERAHAPLPNFIVYTGRGIHLYWTLYEALPAQALPRWQACQRALVKLLNGDKQSADATRVLRMIGTKNSKANDWIVTAEIVVPQRYTFEELAEDILPFNRAEIRDISAARSRRRSQKKNNGRRSKQATGTIFQRWHHVYEDLHRILDHHWFGGVPEGYRNTLLFHLSNSLSWFTRHEALESEISAVARTQIPTLSNREVQTYTSPIVQRAAAAADGQWIEYDGRQVDPRYRYRRQTLYDALAPLIPTELLPEMRAIIPDHLAHERKLARDKARYADSYTGSGVKQQNIDKRAQALKMRSQGLPLAHIAKSLGVTHTTIRRWTKNRK